MMETASSIEHPEAVAVDLEAFRRRLKLLSETPIEQPEPPLADPNKFLENWSGDLLGRLKEIELEEPDFANLGDGDFEAYLEKLREEVFLAEDESVKVSVEIGALARKVAEESAVLDGDIEALVSSLGFIDSQGPHLQARTQDGRSISEKTDGSLVHVLDDSTFQIWELDQQIERSKSYLIDLQELEHVSKRAETVGQLEDTLSATKVIEFEGNCLRLSLRTVIPVSDGLLLRHKLDCLKEPLTLDHELLIEVVDSSMELNNVEIFPGDVSLEEIVATVKSSRHSSIPMTSSSLGWFVRQVQHRILLCGLRRILVKDASKSRHLFEYSDGDELITAHLVGGINAFIKISSGWPLSNSALKLVSVKNTNSHSKSISLSFLCKVEELVNSLEVQKRHGLVSFLDAIEEILIREMHSELHLDNTSA